MKKILIQLDTDQHPSAFDAIAAYDADVDIVLGLRRNHRRQPRRHRPGRDLPAWPRRPGQHRVLGGRVKGARRRGGVRGRAEAVLQAVQPVDHARLRRLQHHRRGGRRTRSTRGAAEGRAGGGGRRRAGRPADGRAAAPRGRRRRDADVPARCDWKAVTAAPRASRSRRKLASKSSSPGPATSSTVRWPAARRCSQQARRACRSCVAAAGRASRACRWSSTTRRPSPSASRGSTAATSLEQEDGVKKLGALAVGGPKMKLQKRCVQRMFESKGTVMDLEGVYEVALEVL